MSSKPGKWNGFFGTLFRVAMGLVFLVLPGFPAPPTRTLEQGTHRIEITLEQMQDSKWIAVDPALVLPSGSFVRFRMKAAFEGFLYVINLSTDGKYSLLFPRQDTGVDNRIQAGKEYAVPATEGGFRVMGPPGHEIVYWLISPVELKQPTELAKSLHEPLPPPPDRKSPVTLLPRCDETMFRARGECIDTSAGPQKISNASDLPESFSGIQGATGRGLEFSRQEKATVVSAAESGSDPVIFEFHLAHR